jgi:hypothetical protein
VYGQRTLLKLNCEAKAKLLVHSRLEGAAPSSRLDLLAHSIHARNTVTSGRVALEILETVFHSNITDHRTGRTRRLVTAAATDGTKDAVGGVALDTDLTAVGTPGGGRTDRLC